MINIGPAHPSTHGVLRIIGCFNAEVIEYTYTEIGLLHRGSEKLIESLATFYTTVAYFDRFDYVSVVAQELLYVNAVEKYINCFVYLYESFVRILLCELYRILNHSLAITTHAIDIGLFTTMLWFFEEREKIYTMLELLIGSRFHLAFLYIGRNRFDVGLTFIESLFYWLLNFVRRLIELFNVLSINNIWIKRLYEIGIINREIILYFGLSGLLIRSSGILLDFRLYGYEMYASIGFNSYISFIGDCLDRYLLRFNEFIESARIIYLALFNILHITSSSSSLSSSLSSLPSTQASSFFGSRIPSFKSTYLKMEAVIQDFLFNQSSLLLNCSIPRTLEKQSFNDTLLLNPLAFFLGICSYNNFYLNSSYVNSHILAGLRWGAYFNVLSLPSSPFTLLKNLTFDTHSSTLPHISQTSSLNFNLGTYVSIESSKGIYSLFLCLENYNVHSFTVNFIASDFLSINALNKYSRNVNLADLIAILGSIDFVLGSVDA